MADYISTDELAKYALKQAIIDQFDPADVTAAIQAACSEADTYLSAYYDTPMTEIPPALKMHVAKAARFHIYDRDGFDPDSLDKGIRDGYTDALAFYKALQKNQQTLPKTGTAPAKGEIAIIVSGERRRVW